MAKTQLFKVELWKRGDKKVRVFVQRNPSGKLVTWKYVAGSKLTKARAAELVKENKTLKKTKKGDLIRKNTTKLTNFTETVQTVKTTIKNRDKKPLINKPRGKIVQYVVSGVFQGKEIIARSQKIGGYFAKDGTEAKKNAWTSFLERVAQASGLDYDEDEGLNLIDKVSNIREGWVSYA